MYLHNYRASMPCCKYFAASVVDLHATDQISIIRFYLPHILESAGIREAISALLGNGVGGAVNFVATLFVILYVSVSL